MPVVFIGKKEWYPIEFSYQALAPTKGANETHDVTTILGFYDEIGGKRYVDKVCELIDKFDQWNPMSKKTLNKFSLERESAPHTLKAKVLEEPVLRFGNNHKVNPANGDWNLRNAKFAV
jgi:hypothetical protein